MNQRYSGSTNRTRKKTATHRQDGRNERYVLTPEEEHAKRQRQIASRRNCQKVKSMNLVYVMFLSAAAIVCAVACGIFISLQTSISTNMKSVAELQTQVSDLKARNDALEKNIETSVDLEQIKQKAINDLGMKYPAADQVVTYSVQSSDYMNQYGSVPEN